MRKAGIRDITIVANNHIVQISEHVGEGLEEKGSAMYLKTGLKVYYMHFN